MTSTRRELIAGSAALLLAGAIRPSTAADRLDALEHRLGVRLGVAALDTASGERIEHRADERFAMCSTFKLPLVALVLALVERGDVPLERRVHFGAGDLLDYAPVVRANVGRGWMTVEELCAASMQASDNTAANLLLGLVGGPEAVTRFARRTGDVATRLDRREPELNQNVAGDARDTTMPRAMVDMARTVLLGDVLRPASRRALTHWMATSTRGLDRLRAGLPQGWHVGTKAGTGANGAMNDVAIAWPPGRRPILIASYMTGGDASAPERAAGHAAVARIIAEAWERR